MPKKNDEIELAKSVFDEIVEETESEDWGKKTSSKTPNPQIRQEAKANQPQAFKKPFKRKP